MDALIRITSHLAKRGSVCYIITRKRNNKFHFPLSPDRTSERSNMGSALQAQNIQEDNSHFVHPTFGNIVKRSNVVRWKKWSRWRGSAPK